MGIILVMIRFHILVGVVFVFAVSSIVQAQRPQDRSEAAAMVNEHVITKQQAFELLARRYPRQAQEVVRELVVQWIIRREYQAERIKIKLATIRQKASEEIAAEKRRVETELKQQWHDYLRLNRISEKQLYQESLRKWQYKLALENLVRLAQLREKRVQARHIMVKSAAKARNILQRLLHHANFAAIARSESQSNTRFQGGKLPLLYSGDISGPLQQAIFSLKPGKYSDVIKTQWGYHIVEVLQIYPPQPQLTWPSARAAIADSLQTTPISPKDFERWLTQMRKKYRVIELFRKIE